MAEIVGGKKALSEVVDAKKETNPNFKQQGMLFSQSKQQKAEKD